MKSENKKPSLVISAVVFISILTTMSLGVILFKIDVISLLVIVLVLVSIITVLLGYTINDLIDMMSKSLQKSAVSLVFFLIIGLLIASWIGAGTVSALIYYGLKFISPMWFLPLGFIVCCITSSVTGTSWGTIGTIGIALLGMGISMNIPSYITAGMIISGAAFGDYLSPMSDTTILASTNSNVDIYEHIRSMLPTAIISFIIVVILFAIIGMKYTGDYDNKEVLKILETLDKTFDLGLITLIPFIVVIILAILKVNSMGTLLIGVALGVIVSVIYQGNNVADVLNALNSGFKYSTGDEIVNSLINRGGIQSMTWTFTLAFIALLISGILEGVGYLNVMLHGLIDKINNVGSLSLVTYVAGIIGCMAMAEVYLSIIINATLFRDVYDKKKVSRSVMSKMLEQGGTLSGFLIPWTTSAAFVVGILDVQTINYIGYSFFLWITPLITIVLAYFKIRVANNKSN